MSTEKVTVVMPAYNTELTIKKSIKSVLSQTYSNLELVIVNDASSDETLSIVESLATKDKRIQVISNQSNSGVAASRNKAIEIAKGDYIAFLDSDDTWEDTKLESQISLMNLRGYNVSHGSYKRVDEQGDVVGISNAKQIVCYKDMLSTNHIGNLTGIYNCKLLGKYYQNDLGHEDYKMWLAILRNNDSIGDTSVLSSYQVGPHGISSNKFKAMKWHFNILYQELNGNIFLSSFYLIKYAFYAIYKRI